MVSSVNINGFDRAGYRKPLIASLISLSYTSTFLGGNDFDFVGSQKFTRCKLTIFFR